MDRRTFLKATSFLTGAALLTPKKIFGDSQKYQLLVRIENGTPEQMIRKSFELLGGISRFIDKGDYVLVKPNISWDRRPEQAATTNPELVAAVVRECYSAGAKKVLIVDNTCNDARRSYKNSRIQEMAAAAGADVRFAREAHFADTPIPNGIALHEWPIHREVFRADKLINIPILKHHSLSGITMGFKNMMGFLGGNRGRIHRSFDENIVDINRVIVPHLTILDAIRVLRRNGPSGGNIGDVDNLNTILAGTDRVLVDAWGAKLFGLNPTDLPYLQLAYKEGMGQIDTEKYKPISYSF